MDFQDWLIASEDSLMLRDRYSDDTMNFGEGLYGFNGGPQEEMSTSQSPESINIALYCKT